MHEEKEMMNPAIERKKMVRHQILHRGIDDEAVLGAMGEVPREVFVPDKLREFAYSDAPLPVDEGQTISQPYIVALMAAELRVRPGDRVLDVGTGSGYAAAVLSRMAGEVYTVERHASLVRWASERFRRLGYDNIHVLHGDGTLGWAEHAPYDAIMVAAGGPEVPKPLLEQLAVGGRLVVPTGEYLNRQRLLLMERTSDEGYRKTDLGAVQFVPLIGAAGWKTESGDERTRPPADAPPTSLADVIRTSCEPFDDIDEADLDGLIDRIGDARVVCIGEASHGTSEFYRMRARITRDLIEKRGFRIVAAEADWPDAAMVDRYARGHLAEPGADRPFTRFPAWMWGNTDVVDFVQWLRAHNESLVSDADRTGFYGLDLYSLFASIESVVRYLQEVDPDAAHIARHRYGCLTPYARDPATYGRAVLSDRYRECEQEVVKMLRDLQAEQASYASHDGRRFFDAVQNARLVAGAEQYYRAMFYGGSAAWNLRDRHMFDTLTALLDFHGDDSRAVVWAHNSHLGDARATDAAAAGQLNVGQLCRERFGSGAYLIGFGTHMGTVAAADNWGEPVREMNVRPSLPGSFERIFHESGIGRFLLPLRSRANAEARRLFSEERLQRAIGVIYRPHTERQSHYFSARLSLQFDEYIWFDTSYAVTPVTESVAEGMPETYPFGL
jgi:protein-L-isoaspartate(D-aspartate) O-methyltransferase